MDMRTRELSDHIHKVSDAADAVVDLTSPAAPAERAPADPQIPSLEAVSTESVVLLVRDAHDQNEPLVVRLREALDASAEMILVVQETGRILFANRSAREVLSLPTTDASFRPVEALLTGSQGEEILEALRLSKQWTGESTATDAEGATINLELTLMADRTGDRIRSITVVARDVGYQRALEAALEHQSTHDGLTGLANRQYLLTQITAQLTELEANAETAALLLLDIDEFRTITNSLGHEAGDRVLVAFAYRLLRAFDSNATIARVGGDEFAVFTPGNSNVVDLAERVASATTAPFYIDGTEVYLTAATGIALHSPQLPAPSAEGLVRRADAASYQAKEAGRGNFEVYDPALHNQAIDRLSAIQDLRRALRNDELRVVFQPKISLGTGQITGAEALLRWETPDGEIRAPGAFMDVAEDTGLIIPMGRWILEQSCLTLAQWQAEVPHAKDLEMSVNLSVRQIEQPAFISDVRTIIEETGVNPASIEFEITESMLMENLDATIDLLRRLKAIGTRIAVDDFGTGYSSLRYLQQFPVDVLKIDQSFVAGLADRTGERAIVTAVVRLAHALKLTPVAEGVENSAQLNVLRGLGCEYAQGYYIAKPMKANAMLELLNENPTW